MKIEEPGGYWSRIGLCHNDYIRDFTIEELADFDEKFNSEDMGPMSISFGDRTYKVAGMVREPLDNGKIRVVFKLEPPVYTSQSFNPKTGEWYEN